MSASSITIMAFLPPISRLTILLSRAHCSAMMRPVAVEPVNEIRRTSLLSTSAAPGLRAPLTRFTTPFGMPAFSQALMRFSDDSGTSSPDLSTTVLPQTERRDELPRRYRHRKIERRDQATNTDWLANAHCKFIRHLGRCRKAVKSTAFARGVVGAVDRLLHVAASFLDDLAHLAGHLASEFVFVCPQYLAEREQDLGPFRCGRTTPACGCVLCRRDGQINVFGRRFRESANDVCSCPPG